MVKVPDEAPRAEALFIFNVPAESVKPFVKVLIPPRVNVPAPFFDKARGVVYSMTI